MEVVIKMSNRPLVGVGRSLAPSYLIPIQPRILTRPKCDQMAVYCYSALNTNISKSPKTLSDQIPPRYPAPISLRLERGAVRRGRSPYSTQYEDIQ